MDRCKRFSFFLLFLYTQSVLTKSIRVIRSAQEVNPVEEDFKFEPQLNPNFDGAGAQSNIMSEINEPSARLLPFLPMNSESSVNNPNGLKNEPFNTSSELRFLQSLPEPVPNLNDQPAIAEDKNDTDKVILHINNNSVPFFKTASNQSDEFFVMDSSNSNPNIEPRSILNVSLNSNETKIDLTPNNSETNLNISISSGLDNYKPQNVLNLMPFPYSDDHLLLKKRDLGFGLPSSLESNNNNQSSPTNSSSSTNSTVLSDSQNKTVEVRSLNGTDNSANQTAEIAARSGFLPQDFGPVSTNQSSAVNGTTLNTNSSVPLAPLSLNITSEMSQNASDAVHLAERSLPILPSDVATTNLTTANNSSVVNNGSVLPSQTQLAIDVQNNGSVTIQQIPAAENSNNSWHFT